MQISISGHHVEITEGIRAAIDNKFGKIRSHYPDVGEITIILRVERNEQRAEADTQYLGARVSAHDVNADLYVAIAETARKLQAALAHRKGTVAAPRGQSLPL